MPANRKNFASAAEMYGLGASLKDVADAYGISRQAMWKALSRRGVVMRPRISTGRGNHFFIHGDGYGKEKTAAKTEVMKAIRAGALVRGRCETCGSSPIAKDGRSMVHAHHADYTRPLDIRWLCKACHHKEHHK